MKYIEGMDYWVRHVQFPNMASESVAVSHGDGTFTIYINTLFPEERQQQRLRHELRHLAQEHFYRDDLTITQIEHAADGQTAAPPTVPAAATAAALASPTPSGSPLPPLTGDGVGAADGGGVSPGATVIRRTLPGPQPSFVAVRWDGQPEDVTFGFRVPDDSLLPRFRQGEFLCCDDRPLSPGDVSLFQYRGVTVCRRYHRDVFGITYLFAVNRADAHRDITVPACEEQELLCLGRVQTESAVFCPTDHCKTPV